MILIKVILRPLITFLENLQITCPFLNPQITWVQSNHGKHTHRYCNLRNITFISWYSTWMLVSNVHFGHKYLGIFDQSEHKKQTFRYWIIRNISVTLWFRLETEIDLHNIKRRLFSDTWITCVRKSQNFKVLLWDPQMIWDHSNHRKHTHLSSQ